MIKYLLLIIILFSCSTLKKFTPRGVPIVIDTIYVSEQNYINNYDYAEPSVSEMKQSKRNVSIQEEINPHPITIDNSKPNIIYLPGEKQIVPKEMGRLVYNIPDTMKLGRMETIVVRINRDVSDHSISRGVVGIDTTIRVTQTMDVSLVDPSGNSFNIKKNNDGVMLIEHGEYTEWVFDVTPLRSGKNKLNLVISIMINGNKKQQVYSDIIVVKTDTIIVIKTWWDKYWQWCFSTLLLPLFFWLRSKRKSHK